MIWYNSLTDEQKERLKEIRRRKREKAEYEFNTAMMQLFSMYSVLSSRVPKNCCLILVQHISWKIPQVGMTIYGDIVHVTGAKVNHQRIC